MKALDTEFSNTLGNFKQLSRSDKGFIYKREIGGLKAPYYEVFEVKTCEMLKDFETKEGSGEFKERYPKDNDFGVWAWCFNNLKKATDKFNSL